MLVVPPSPPTRVGSTRTLGGPAGAPVAEPLRLDGGRRRAVGALDGELDLDAVADDPGERLADQRAVAGLEPVLGEAVRDGDPEALVVDVDELRCRAATSRSSRARARPAARRGRRARPASHPSGRWSILLGRVWMGRGDGHRQRGSQGREGLGRRFGIAGRRSRGPGSVVPRAYPRASRRRGLGEDSTAGTAAARRFCDTPREYHARRPGQGRRAASSGRPGVV